MSLLVAVAAALLPVSALLLGAVAVDALRLRPYAFEAVALVVVLGLFGWAWLAFLLALVMPLVLAVPIATAAPFVVAAGWWRRRWGGWRPAGRWWVLGRPLPRGRRGTAVWAGVTGVTALVLGPLFWTHNLPAGDDGVWSAGSTWADFGLHAAIVTHIAQADRLPMDLPIAAGAQMTYPYLVDLLSGLWVYGGWSLHLALFVPGLLLALAVCQLVIAFGLRLFGSLVAASAGLGLFLLTGTAAGLPLAYADWRASGQSLPAFLAALPRDYTTLSDINGNVTGFVAHALLPQRGMLFGIGVGLAVLILFHEARADGSRRTLVAGAVLLGLLPFVRVKGVVDPPAAGQPRCSGTTAQLTLWMAARYGAIWDSYCGRVNCGFTSNFRADASARKRQVNRRRDRPSVPGWSPPACSSRRCRGKDTTWNRAVIRYVLSHELHRRRNRQRLQWTTPEHVVTST